jgi:hypothetical protein
MRAFIVTLLFAAAPIYLSGAIFGDNSAFSLSNFTSMSNLRDELGSSDMTRDAISQARDYAVSHPGLVEELKAHRAEIEDLRSRLCSSARC